MYEITRDGFAFLAMGFTGRKAAQWKETFIAAFNAMEQELLNDQVSKAPETVPKLPAQIAEITVKSLLRIADSIKVPRHYAVIEVMKSASVQSGMDLIPLANRSSYLDDIPDHERMLEPKDLEIRLGLGKSGRTINKILADAGWQVKEFGSWTPTEKGAPFCKRHAWVKGSKSGYNLKWNVSAVRELIADYVNSNEE
jgi:hypothetical protein